MASATYVIEVDWNNDGDFGDSYDVITNDVKSVRISYGKDSELGRASAGILELRVNNDDNKYSPKYSSSPIYGDVKIKRVIQVRSTDPVSKTLFKGKIEKIVPHPDLNVKDCYISAIDGTDHLSRAELDTVLYKDQKTGYLVDKIVDEAYENILTNGSFEDGDPPDDWSIGASATVSQSSTDPKTGEYCVSITNVASSEGYIQQHPALSYGGKTVTISGWVKTSTASRVALTIHDNNGGGYESSSSSYHSGSGEWEWLTVTRTLRTGLTDWIGRCRIISGTSITAYFDGVILIEGVHPPAKMIDGGQDTVPYGYWHQQKCRSSIGDIEDSEFGFFIIGGDGTHRFEDRHHRYSATHQTSQATFNNTMMRILYSQDAHILYNEARATVTPWELQSLAEVWRLEETPYFDVGETKTYWGNFEYFADAITTPVATTDYTANSEAGGGGDDHTSDISITTTKFAKSVKLEITNNASVPVYLTLMKIRATYYDDKTKVSRKYEDADSIKTYQRRTLTLDGKYLTDADLAQDFCEYAVSRFKDEQPQLGIEIINKDNTNLTQILSREVSDRITIQHTNLGIDEDYFIDHIEHTIDNGGLRHSVVWRVSLAENEGFATLGYSRLDDPDCKLAY